MKFHGLLNCGILSTCFSENSYPSNESEHRDIVIPDVQPLFEENTSGNMSLCDSKKNTKDETANGNAKKSNDISIEEEIKEEKEEESAEADTGDSNLHIFKNILFLEEKYDANAKNKNEHEKQVNKMSEMKQIMVDFFGTFKKSENKKFTEEMLMKDKLNNKIQKAEFEETDVPKKRELNPSVLMELKSLVQKLIDVIQFERLKEVDYTSDEEENIILAEMIFPQENELTTLQVLTDNTEVVESIEAEDSVRLIKNQANREDVNNFKEVVEFKQMATEYLEAIEVKKLRERKMCKALTENKSNFKKIVQNALETIVEEENMEESNLVTQSDTEEEPQKSDINILTEEANASLEIDDKNDLLSHQLIPFRRRYIRTIRKSNKKKL